MKESSRRKTTRSRTWPETRAVIEVPDPRSTNKRKSIKITGQVIDIGSTGMFLKTSDFVPLHSMADIKIYFGPSEYAADLEITAKGNVIRRGEKGIGIHFTSINLSRLQECIITRMNLIKMSISRDQQTRTLEASIKELPNLYKLRDYKAE